MSRLVLLTSLMVLFVVALMFQPVALSQTSPTGQAPPKRPPQELLRLSIAAETPGLAEPFKGVTTNGRSSRASSPSARRRVHRRCARRRRRVPRRPHETQRDKTLYSVGR